MAWLLLSLAQHSDIQEKARIEDSALYLIKTVTFSSNKICLTLLLFCPQYGCLALFLNIFNTVINTSSYY